ncbi:MAG: NifU N-terminal domain-containing protein [Acidimicrobiia bacterium]|nr:NifU N-terminal domain-containing protein [Acidimicrobiia bacterium]
MGQPVVVAEQPSRSNRGVVRFETNRPLTGMGHERYPNRESATGVRPPDELARRLFDHGGVDRVHMNGNIVTVDLLRGYTSEGLREIIEDLFLYYREPTGDAAEDTEVGGGALAESGAVVVEGAEPAAEEVPEAAS